MKTKIIYQHVIMNFGFVYIDAPIEQWGGEVTSSFSHVTNHATQVAYSCLVALTTWQARGNNATAHDFQSPSDTLCCTSCATLELISWTVSIAWLVFQSSWWPLSRAKQCVEVELIVIHCCVVSPCLPVY